MIDKIFTKEEVEEIFSSIELPKNISNDFLYSTYFNAAKNINELTDTAVKTSLPVNSLNLLLYVINEHCFKVENKSEEEIKELENDTNYQSQIMSLALDKCLTNEQFSYQSPRLISKFSPQISTILLYVNFVLNMLKRYRHNDPKTTLIVDMLSKGFLMAKCIIDLLVNGFETEAFSTWRTLHETECILTIIFANNKNVIDRYLKHMHYAMAFRGAFEKDETDKTFEIMKKEMFDLGLKSKDMKKYIEYGWLLAVDEFKNDPEHKFNFRDGVEKTANLPQYAKVYEMSSEIAHSSPLLIYSKKNYFFMLTLLNLYESFFRLEAIFSNIYISSVSKDEVTRYIAMRNLYYPQLVDIHDSQQNIFKKDSIKRKA